MRALLYSTMVIALLSSTSAIATGPTPLGFSDNHTVEPVLVKVDEQGKVTDILPAYPLTPELTRLLRVNLSEMIHSPATDKNGKPVATQLIMKLALQVDKRSSGDYDAHFVSLSVKPLPLGKWFWSRDAVGQLALASADGQMNYSSLNGSYSNPGGATLGAANGFH
jgi:hypothetical protein